MAAHREVSPALRLLRTFLLGVSTLIISTLLALRISFPQNQAHRPVGYTVCTREYNMALRFPDEVSTRSPPPPHLPPGPCSKLAMNYYCTRDARRCAQPPVVLIDATTGARQIEAGGQPGALKIPTPGAKYLP